MQSPVKTINVQELKIKMDNEKPLLLIDVRELHEWQMERIPGAIHIPKDSIPTDIESKAPDKNTPVYLHCRSGARSLYAAQYLMALDYEEVYSVDGGILDWMESGYSVER